MSTKSPNPANVSTASSIPPPPPPMSTPQGGVGPHPPPPPPPPALGGQNDRGLHLKRVNWEKLSASNVQGTVWSQVCTVCTVAASLSPHCSHIDWQSMQICVRVWFYANCPLVDYSVRVCLRTGHCSYIYVYTYVSPHVDQERSI